MQSNVFKRLLPGRSEVGDFATEDPLQKQSGLISSRMSPALSVAMAALAQPALPDPSVFIERVASVPRAVQNCQLCREVNMPIYCVIEANKVTANGHFFPVYLVVGALHVMMLKPNGSVGRVLRYSELSHVVVDNTTGSCLLVPTSVAGERMWLWYWNTAATVANQFLGALLQCRRAALGGAELPVHFRPIAGSEVDLNFNKAIMRTRWDREEDVRADYDHVAREELMYWEEEARAHAEASRSAVPDVTSAQANSLAIELHQRKVERATIAVAAAAGVAGWKAGQEAILRHLEDDVRRLQREDDRLRGELHKVQFRTASIVVQRMSAVHVLRDQNYRDEPDAHGHLRKPSASPRPSRPAGPSAEPFPLPPYPVRPEFEEVPAIIPVTSGAASPRRNLRAAPPVTGVRPAVELARFDDVYTLFRGEWAAGGAERGTVAGVYRALQAGGVRVSEHCWLPDGRLQLTVAPRTPLPRVVAVAGALGCACFAQDGAELALEGLNDTL